MFNKIRPLQILKRLLEIFVSLILYNTIIIQFMAPHVLACTQFIIDEEYFSAVIEVRFSRPN